MEGKKSINGIHEDGDDDNSWNTLLKSPKQHY